MKKQSKFLIPFLLAMFAIQCPTKADVLVSTDFDNGYTTGALNGQSTSGDVGLSGSWSSSSQAQLVAATGSDDLTYNVAGGGTISSGSNVVQYISNSGSPNIVFSANLTTPISGQTVYARLVISGVNPSSNSSTDLDFFANSSGSGTYGKIQGTGLGQFGGPNAGAGTGSGYGGNQNAISNTAVTTTPTLLIAAFNWDATAGGYDSVSLWVDPSATMGLPDATASLNLLTGTPTPSIDKIGLAVANISGGDPANNIPGNSYDFDSFAIGTTWNDVVPQAIPEPSSWALMATGLAALIPVLRRRYKMGN